jgi:hypothetical protein
MSSFESINQTFSYKNKNIVSETWKTLCVVSNFYVILLMLYETTWTTYKNLAKYA